MQADGSDRLLSTEQFDHVHLLTINRPDKLNAFTPARRTFAARRKPGNGLANVSANSNDPQK